MRNLLLLITMILLFVGCTQQKVHEAITLPKVNRSYMVLKDDSLGSKYILNSKNYIKSYDDMDVEIENTRSGDMILSSVVNFSRASTDDKIGILQPDKIFSNLVTLEYLELPLSYSKRKLALLELLSKGQIRSIRKKKLNNNKFEIEYSKTKPKDKINELNSNNDDIKLDDSTDITIKEVIKKCKDRKSFYTEDEPDKYHDRSMVSIFAKNELGLKGFTKIENNDNLELKYVETCKDNNGTFNETYSLIKETISELIENNTDVVSMSIRLFDSTSEVESFLKDKSNLDSRYSFTDCIKNNNCPNDKFIWVVSLGNLEHNKTKEINSTKAYKDFYHTKFITTVSSISEKNNYMTFEQQGKQFIDAGKDIDYFSINLPKKTLLAYDANVLKFRKASTSYATAIFSAIVYNMYSLNPYLNENEVTKILKETSFNYGCKDNEPFVMYNVGKNKDSSYRINCKKHKPSKVGHIVNMKEAYIRVIKKLLEKHNKAFFTQGDINNSLYTEKSYIEKTTVINKDEFLVKRIKLENKNISNMNLGHVEIKGLDIQFSKNKIICRYEQDFSSYDTGYYDTTFKEITIKYEKNGLPYIEIERNLFSK